MSTMMSLCPPTTNSCGCLRRRELLLIGAGTTTTLLHRRASAVVLGSQQSQQDPMVVMEKVHPARPDWYEEFYAQAMAKGMASYEAQIAGYKKELFVHLRGMAKKSILELGVGTGPNFKYYAAEAGAINNLKILGVDPNRKMEKYARESALVSGLPSANFSFMRGVTEALPVADNSQDAVIGTLVLCSVTDVDTALKEVKRVLKPGGMYLFIEHVAASDGSVLRYVQTLLDPLQQFIADGCHLTRETGRSISEAGFTSASINTTYLPNAALISPHIFGFACK